MNSNKQLSGAGRKSLRAVSKSRMIVHIGWTSMLIAVLLPCAHAIAADGGIEGQTAHYDLYVEGWDVDVVGAFLEQAHTQMTRFFGAQPNERLRVKIFANQDRYRTALA